VATFPSFIHISDGKLGDVNVLDVLVLEPGAIYVMDRGYLDFARLYLMHQAHSFFVTRAKSNTQLRRVYSAAVDRSTGIICDQTVALTGTTSRKDYPEYLRRIRFKDPETGKKLVFLTNNFTLPAITICALYKRRWQVELFFDALSYCTPAYVIEYPRLSDLDCWFAEILFDEMPRYISRRPLSIESRAH
jgi:IS4 transposase